MLDRCGWYHVLLDKELEYFAPGFHDYADLDSQGAKLVLNVATTSILDIYYFINEEIFKSQGLNYSVQRW